MDTIFGIGIIATFIFIVVMCFDKSEHSVRPVVVQDNRQIVINVNPTASQLSADEANSVLARASAQYNVPFEILNAIWYLESRHHLGGTPGKHNALRQIKQKQYGEYLERYQRHEKNLYKISKKCAYDLRTLRGSSTGALGPMQQMPNFTKMFGKDGNGDGIICPTDLADAMSTAAFFLRRRYEQTGSWQTAVRKYAGAGPKARAYAKRAMRLAKL